MTTPAIGDTWTPDPENCDCPAKHPMPFPFHEIEAYCLRPAGHEAPHISVDEEFKVVEVWV